MYSMMPLIVIETPSLWQENKPWDNRGKYCRCKYKLVAASDGHDLIQSRSQSKIVLSKDIPRRSNGNWKISLSVSAEDATWYWRQSYLLIVGANACLRRPSFLWKQQSAHKDKPTTIHTSGWRGRGSRGVGSKEEENKLNKEKTWDNFSLAWGSPRSRRQQEATNKYNNY